MDVCKPERALLKISRVEIALELARFAFPVAFRHQTFNLLFPFTFLKHRSYLYSTD